MQYKYRVFSVVVCLLVLGLTSVSLLGAQDNAGSTDLVFVNHILAGMPEQDVYFPTEDGMVQRIAGDVPLSSIGSPLYMAAEAQEHDPLMLSDEPLGPFAMGEELGMTLGAWLKASGSGTYAVDGNRAMLELSFHDLVPNGVYTVWCSVLAMPPDFLITDYPCGAEDGSNNMFTADESGDAIILGRGQRAAAVYRCQPERDRAGISQRWKYLRGASWGLRPQQSCTYLCADSADVAVLDCFDLNCTRYSWR